MESTVRIPHGHAGVHQLGAGERNLKMIREALGVRIGARDGLIHLSGDDRSVAVARSVLERLGGSGRSKADHPTPDLPKADLTRSQVLTMIAEEAERADQPRDPGPAQFGDHLTVFAGGRPIKAKTPNQRAYLDAIASHDLTFGLGPAGTGKTYLAVAAAVHLLRRDSVSKLILVRPAVEAGERLGFLPGSLEEKVDPYLRPLMDALSDMMDLSAVRSFLDAGVIEVAPLAFMRGRTLNRAVVILDEAQNTTKAPMHMFLTRLGQGSKMIVTGDPTQMDLPDNTESGLVDAARRLTRVPGIAFCQLTGADVIRHGLVQRIIDAYEGSGRGAMRATPDTGGTV